MILFRIDILLFINVKSDTWLRTVCSYLIKSLDISHNILLSHCRESAAGYTHDRARSSVNWIALKKKLITGHWTTNVIFIINVCAGSDSTGTVTPTCWRKKVAPMSKLSLADHFLVCTATWLIVALPYWFSSVTVTDNYTLAYNSRSLVSSCSVLKQKFKT